jgi:hypothetical protein
MSTFTLNGRAHSFNGDPEMPLLWYLRDVSNALAADCLISTDQFSLAP